MKKTFILIVDNDIENLTLCKDILEAKNFGVISAKSPEDALNIYRELQNNIQVILLNLQLSGKTFFFSVPAFFAINEGAKIIAMSDMLDQDELSEYYKNKFYGFIKKPVQEGILIKYLEKFEKIKNR